ncbi:hypothetical protein A3L11_08230 [Thermococcus siculi]|uniref:Uncharacterized protein n=1 Tax=Thermococcus siculi TaxID=72803 RepID=A0A2Z2MTW4_9EURY|nr:hypothetical protein [Thermococcus siculi]ASJ09216.1 hypothetical protein A3L11_08230 [Thermococcus siculi]
MNTKESKPSDEEKIRAVLPWGDSGFLTAVMKEKAKEKAEALEIVESLVKPDILPDEVKSIVKKPDKKELIEDVEE